jgi:hypothetical protein
VTAKRKIVVPTVPIVSAEGRIRPKPCGESVRSPVADKQFHPSLPNGESGLNRFERFEQFERLEPVLLARSGRE